jgi:hypothetical protein
VQRITELPQFVNRAEPVGAPSKSAQYVRMVDMSVSLILNDVGARSAPLTPEKEQASLIWTQDWGPRPELPTTEVCDPCTHVGFFSDDFMRKCIPTLAHHFSLPYPISASSSTGGA